MPARITPIDVTSYASPDVLVLGEKIFENELVKHRFQTDYGLRATVRSKGVFQVEMIVDNEQLFGRCDCAAGSSPCEHKVATLLAWLNESNTFTDYQTLRKSIRNTEKNSLVEMLVNLIELFPELVHFFVQMEGQDELGYIRNKVADIFDFPHSEKTDPDQVAGPGKIMLVWSRYLRHENKWRQSRIVIFELLNRILSLIDQEQLAQPLPESFIAGIADEYIDVVLTDPDADAWADDLAREVPELLMHPASEEYGVILDPVKNKFNI